MERKKSPDSTVQKAIQQHVVEHAERDKALKMLRSSTASKPNSRRLDLCLASVSCLLLHVLGNYSLDSQHSFDAMNGALTKNNALGYRKCINLEWRTRWVYSAENCSKHLNYSQSYLCEYSKYYFESMREKTNNLVRPGPTQSRLYSHRRWLEAGNFGFRKSRNCTIRVAKTKAQINFAVAKTKALISFAVSAKLICTMQIVGFLMRRLIGKGPSGPFPQCLL